MQKQKLLVTGGAGFIGSHFVDAALASDYSVLTVDKLDYCGNLLNLEKALANKSHKFVKGDIADADTTDGTYNVYEPTAGEAVTAGKASSVVVVGSLCPSSVVVVVWSLSGNSGIFVPSIVI